VWFLNDGILFLHFCDYFLYEDHLVLSMNKLEFPLKKNYLYQKWLKIDSLLWRFLNIFFSNINTSKNGFSYCGPTWLPPPKSHDFNKYEYALVRTFHVNLTFSGRVVLETISEWPNPMLTFFWLSPFKDDLTLYLNKDECPSLKDDLYQVWLK
jgi:hypothetical protein